MRPITSPFSLAARVIDIGRASFPPMSESIDVVINGEARRVLQGTTVAALIGELGFGDRRVAVERNREVVPRAQHGSTVLAAGDRLELVTFVGGG
jgi:sulfur carrier protein